MPDLDSLRAEFPVLERVAYLNAGTDGPVPARAARAAAERTRVEVECGRAGLEHFMSLAGMGEALRERIAALLGCAPDEVALTRSTTDGVNTVLSGLRLERGDEVITSDEEHPGLLAPLASAKLRRGVELSVVPFDELPGAVGERTRLVACSHVSWVSGRVVDTEALRAAGVPVLLDGAQGLGAVPADVSALGCDFYAASGQKWLCGPDGSGYLYVRAGALETLDPPWPNFLSLADPSKPLELVLHDSSRRYDMGVPGGPGMAWSLASLEVLEEAGWSWAFERSRELAAELAALLEERGRRVAPRDGSTLVSWADDDAEGTAERLRQEGVLVRHLPGRGLVRASVGAWTSESEVERLVALA